MRLTRLTDKGNPGNRPTIPETGIWVEPKVSVDRTTLFEETAPSQSGQIAFHVYDPNYTDAPRTLVYDLSTQTFSYSKTFYFLGGLVHVRPMYTSLLR